MPLLETKGAASAQGFGMTIGGAAPVYIEDVFSTWLWAGTNAQQTITNGIDLSGKGGLVWTKNRTSSLSNELYDTNRGAQLRLVSNTTAAQSTDANGVRSFSSTGFVAGTSISVSGQNYVSWTFREQPKFFDVVTYTGNGSDPQTISHNLGSVPGCMIVKRTDSATNGSWYVYHRSLTTPSATATNNYLLLNTTDASVQDNGYWGFGSSITATTFQVNNQSNANGATYVAYLFAHNAGGFGLTGTDNVISCGSYTGTGALNNQINLGYEPQFVMIKSASVGGENWWMFDTMRGMPTSTTTAAQGLSANTAGAEGPAYPIYPTATGFVPADNSGGAAINGSGVTYIYIAIRRGPMKVPTSGTSVFSPIARTGNSTNTTVTGGSGVTDLAIIKRRDASASWVWTPRLTGTGYLSSQATTVETAAGTTILQANPWDVMDGVKVGTTSLLTNASGATYVNYLVDRAPSFMDVVCYTANASYTPVPHNLTVVPELVIQKKRSGSVALDWYVTGFQSGKYLRLNSTDAAANISSTYTTQTATTFMPIVDSDPNVAYLFATCAGVSKVGSYTGNGSTQTINCGFTGGARFVAVKRTDATGAWYVFDTARGMVAGSDFFLLFDATSGETNFNSVYTASGGFEIVTNGGGINASGGTYIYLAIA